jgi:signal transduction histidine kinase
VRKDGSRFWAYGVITAMRDEAGKLLGFSKVAHDMTELRRVREVLETKVQERTAQLQASLNSIEELLYTIAHDLRAPNRSMQGFAQLLKSEYGNKLDPIARDYLDRIASAAVRNDELIRDLLEYGRLSHEAAPLAPVDLRRTVEAIVRALEGEIAQSHAHIRLGREWPFVLANEPLLKQILTNLATNALTYVPPDREPEILISASKQDGKTVLRVQDNGIGIPPEQIDRVFMPFVRLPNPVNATGTGMGLAIVRKAAERMNGVLGVESTPGKGSCFKLELSTA